MNKFIIGAVIVALAAVAYVFFCPAANANENFDVWQHDFAVTGENLSVSLRTYTDADYDHVQLTYKLPADFVVGYRYAEENGIKEHRGIAAYQGLAYGPLYVTPIVTYSSFDGIEGIDHFRLGVRAGLEHDYKGFKAFAWHEPRAVFGADVDEFDFIGSKSEAGLLFPVGKAQFGPFVQVWLDDDYKYHEGALIAGTKFVATF